jgi:hypothetical protein
LFQATKGALALAAVRAPSKPPTPLSMPISFVCGVTAVHPHRGSPRLAVGHLTHAARAPNPSNPTNPAAWKSEMCFSTSPSPTSQFSCVSQQPILCRVILCLVRQAGVVRAQPLCLGILDQSDNACLGERLRCAAGVVYPAISTHAVRPNTQGAYRLEDGCCLPTWGQTSWWGPRQ